MSARAAYRDNAAGRTAQMRFIDPAVLARIGNLELVARAVVDGFVSGLHRAVYHGMSTEFAEHRPYVGGDDVRRIDWRVFARTDRLYVKTFEAETNADLVLALDVSRSMDFASGPVTKLDYARFILASLTYLGGRQRDRVGLVTFDGEIVDRVPPSAGARSRTRSLLLGRLERARAERGGALPAALGELARSLTRRGIVVVVSDFYAEPDAIAVALDEIRVRGQDVIAFHVLDPAERDLATLTPGRAGASLEDLETGERLPLGPGIPGAAYRRLVDAHVARLEQHCGERRIDYARLDTDQPLDEMLSRFLSSRARLARKR